MHVTNPFRPQDSEVGLRSGLGPEEFHTPNFILFSIGIRYIVQTHTFFSILLLLLYMLPNTAPKFNLILPPSLRSTPLALNHLPQLSLIFNGFAPLLNLKY